MFVVQLKFASAKAKAPEFMEAHKDWIRQGFEDGVFLMVGSLQPNAGGAVIAHNIARDALERRVAEDPFVSEGVVEAEIVEISPARTDARLSFLMAS